MQEFSPRISKALQQLQITSLKPVQEAALAAHQPGNDVILLAPTGSGKTLAFLLPLLERLQPGNQGIQALILAPSRELALQITDVFTRMGTGFKVSCFYGGHPIPSEINSLQEPPAVLIGTPGRIADHLRRQTFQPDTICYLLLDEFDKALELGFAEQMAFIISQLPGLQRRTLTSATRPVRIPDFVGLRNPAEVNFLTGALPQGLALKQVVATGNDKLDTLFHLLCQIGREATLVFCNHREAAERISQLLSGQGLIHDIYHGGLEQEARDRALIKFRNGSSRVLLTTDLASRGLDVPQLQSVVHYQLPPTEEAFVHRNGRTARMQAEGTAYLLVSESEPLPPYLEGPLPVFDLSRSVPLPELPPWVTLYVGAGKKEKISKTDIVGLLLQKGKLNQEEVGLIEIRDHASFAAIRREKAPSVLSLLRQEKIKGQKVKIQLAR